MATTAKAITTAMQKGYRYEKWISEVFTSEYHMKLMSTGGPQDGGIDHIGSWTFPDQKTVSLIGQCKDENRVSRVSTMREFEAVLSREVSQNPNTLGWFCTRLGYGTPARRLAMSMQHPCMLWTVSDNIRVLEMNNAARDLVPKLVPARRMKLKSSELVLVYDGKIWSS